ncbi:MAG: ribonuclease P protein component [Acidimicrobiia bacterium]|nr:ribonuclease P protein component [Acidimicrobiia bacterium]
MLMLEGPSVVPRIGIVAGKKVGNAVNRNRAKRRLREAASSANLRSQTDYILIASPETIEIAFQDLIEAISGKDER